MKKNALMSSLTAKVEHLYAQHLQSMTQKVQLKFSPGLFSENNQTFEFYYQEIHQTLKQLENVAEHDLALCTFFAEKLLSQCNALSDALNPHRETKSIPRPSKIKTQQTIHQLPPRERLEKYYEALQALNEKITRQQDEKRKAQHANELALIEHHIAFTQQRRAKCLMAIDVLEEYLAFKENQA
ncbi:primosomal replication protein PriC [Pasteurella sp. P03HT]